jgi:hypothetical protein
MLAKNHPGRYERSLERESLFQERPEGLRREPHGLQEMLDQNKSRRKERKVSNLSIEMLEGQDEPNRAHSLDGLSNL